MAMNISDMVSEVELQPAPEFIADTTSRIYQGAVTMITVLFGSISYLGIIFYERYGGDPLKRSIQNRMISATSFSALMMCYITNAEFTWRFQMGPLNEDLVMLGLSINRYFVVFLMINLSEIMIYKVFYYCLNIELCSEIYFLLTIHIKYVFALLLLFP